MTWPRNAGKYSHRVRRRPVSAPPRRRREASRGSERPRPGRGRYPTSSTHRRIRPRNTRSTSLDREIRFVLCCEGIITTTVRRVVEVLMGTVLLILLVVVIVVLVVYAIVTYNGLVRRRNEAEEAYKQIDVQLKRRYDLIPNLLEGVKKYFRQEQQV